MSVVLQWADDGAITRTVATEISKLERKVTGEQKEVPVRRMPPFYIPLGFTGPEVTVGFGFASTSYVDVITLHPDIIVTVTSADAALYPELPQGSEWNITGITIGRDAGQQMSHLCELKLMMEW